MIKAFGGSKTARGNTGPFWVGSGLAIFSALVVLFLVKPLSHDGMVAEDAAFRKYLEEHGFDTSAMGAGDSTTALAASEGSLDENEKGADPANVRV
jgi:hypothetical protein